MVDTRRAVLTTGANSGIGLETVLELARRGYRSIGSVRSQAKAEIVHKAAADAGVEVETVLLDVTDAEQCEEKMAGLELYGLVNNAGYSLMGAVEDVPDGEIRRVFETMVFAPMRLARLALPAMRANGEGRIVNVSSILGRVTMPFAGHYQATKHALEALSDALRIEVAGAGVKVVLVEPGAFRTGIWDEYESDIERRQASGSRYSSAYHRALRSQRLLEPLMGQPASVARTVAAALQARVPRARYLVGADAQLTNLVYRFTPTPMKDVVARLTLGL